MDDNSMARPGTVARRETPGHGSAAAWLAPPPHPLAQAPTASVKSPPHKAMPSQRPVPLLYAAPSPAAAAEVAAAAAAPHRRPLQLALRHGERLASPDSVMTGHGHDGAPPPPPPPGSRDSLQVPPPPPPVPVKKKPTAAVKITQKTAVMLGAPQEVPGVAPLAKATAPYTGRETYWDDRPKLITKPPPHGFRGPKPPGHAPAAGHAPLMTPQPLVKPPPQEHREDPRTLGLPPWRGTMEMARQAAQAAADAQEILEQAQLRADAATLAAARAAAAAGPELLEISDEEAEAAPGHEPGHDDPGYDHDWPHGWYGG